MRNRCRSKLGVQGVAYGDALATTFCLDDSLPAATAATLKAIVKRRAFSRAGLHVESEASWFQTLLISMIQADEAQ